MKVDLYTEGLKRYGFYTVDEPLKGDVMLFNLGGRYPNHAGIYMGIIGGCGVLLHHELNSLSKLDNIEGYLRDRLVSIWRHKEAPNLDFQKINKDFRRWR